MSSWFSIGLSIELSPPPLQWLPFLTNYFLDYFAYASYNNKLRQNLPVELVFQTSCLFVQFQRTSLSSTTILTETGLPTDRSTGSWLCSSRIRSWFVWKLKQKSIKEMARFFIQTFLWIFAPCMDWLLDFGIWLKMYCKKAIHVSKQSMRLENAPCLFEDIKWFMNYINLKSSSSFRSK